MLLPLFLACFPGSDDEEKEAGGFAPCAGTETALDGVAAYDGELEDAFAFLDCTDDAWTFSADFYDGVPDAVRGLVWDLASGDFGETVDLADNDGSWSSAVETGASCDDASLAGLVFALYGETLGPVAGIDRGESNGGGHIGVGDDVAINFMTVSAADSATLHTCDLAGGASDTMEMTDDGEGTSWTAELSRSDGAEFPLLAGAIAFSGGEAIGSRTDSVD